MKIKKRRLLNVAKACRESKHAADFTMERFGHVCGTPACALGNYAARRDLQDDFSLSKFGSLRERRHRHDIGINDEPVLKHFGITNDQSDQLFGQNGCGNAMTAIQAAKYIERFVAESD